MQILFRHPQNLFAIDTPDQIPIAVWVIEPELEVLHLSEETRHLAVGIETERKAADQVVFGIVKLLFADRFLAHPPYFVISYTDRLQRAFVFGLHDEFERAVVLFRGKKTVDRVCQPSFIANRVHGARGKTTST